MDVPKLLTSQKSQFTINECKKEMKTKKKGIKNRINERKLEKKK